MPNPENNGDPHKWKSELAFGLTLALIIWVFMSGMKGCLDVYHNRPDHSSHKQTEK